MARVYHASALVIGVTRATARKNNVRAPSGDLVICWNDLVWPHCAWRGRGGGAGDGVGLLSGRGQADRGQGWLR